jgi:hypothetical protein
VEVEGETLLEGEVENGWGEGQVLLYPGEAALDGVLHKPTTLLGYTVHIKYSSFLLLKTVKLCKVGLGVCDWRIFFCVFKAACIC